MEIALSGFTQQFDSSASTDAARQRQQQESQRQTSAGDNRARENQSRQNQSRAESNQRTPPSTENSRIINGEVLSSETRRVDARETNPGLFSGSANQQPSGQPDTRRVSAQQAIQTFQENEDIVPEGNQQRQVSGIIDEFV